MKSKWQPKKGWEKEIEEDRMYTRNEACEALHMSGGAFARNVKDNSLWIAFGKPVKVGRRILYPGSELIEQVRRIYDNEKVLDLLSSYHRDGDIKFKKTYGKPKSEVFREGSYIEFGGWREGDTWV